MIGATEPVHLEVDTATFVLLGRTGRYEKRLGELDGLYRDAAAFRSAVDVQGADSLVYWVDECRVDDEADGSLITGLSVLLPGRIGAEFAMTRGHLHARADRAELYHCVAGTGVMLMDSLDGRTRAVPLSAGHGVHVPGHWVHRSVNTGDDIFATIFCYPADAGQDYQLIASAGGMRQLVVADGVGGWDVVDNPDHRGYV
jgi:glucose-6-phosphate isomerase